MLIQAEFCSGGSLQDHLKLLLDARNRGCKRAATSSSDRRYDGCDREVIGPKSRKVYTPEAELMAKAEEEKRKRRSPQTDATAAAAATSKPGGEVPLTETRRKVAALSDGSLARRLEVWMRQVNRWLTSPGAGSAARMTKLMWARSRHTVGSLRNWKP